MTSSGSSMPPGPGMRRGGWGGWGNVPLPEPHLLAIAAGVWLDRKRPWPLPGRRSVHHLAGWPLVGAGVCLVGRSWKAAAQVDLGRPALLVTTGPYAVGRNPMYVGWALLHLGTGLVRGSGWLLAALPVAVAQVHREVHREERTLEEVFGEDFRRYRASVPRYLHWPLRRRGRR